MTRVYAYRCTDCNHLASDHRLAEDGDVRDGPYCCGHCPCEQPQDGAFLPISTRQQYERYTELALTGSCENGEPA